MHRVGFRTSEPLATQIRIAPGPHSEPLTVPVEPALHACHGGGITLCGLYPGP